MVAKKRSKKPSRAVTQSAVVGSPLAILGGAALVWAQNKYNLDAQTMTVAASLLASLTASAIAYKSKGGRSGESD